MVERARGKRRGSVEGDKGETSTTGRKTPTHEEGDHSYMLRRQLGMPNVVDEGDDVSSSSVRDCMAKKSEGESSNGESVLLKVFFGVFGGYGGGSSSEREGRSSRRGKRVSDVLKLELLWKCFEEVNLTDSSKSDFDGGGNDVGDNSPNVSLVSESELENSSEGEIEKDSRSKKVVLREKRRGRWKAVVMV